MKTKNPLFAFATTLIIIATAVSARAAVFNEYFDYSSTPTVGTDAANMNGSQGQVGTWSNASLPTAANSPAAPELVSFQQQIALIDRPTADAFIRGNFARPLPLNGTQVNYDFGLSRTITDHRKDVEMVGLDASGNEAFRLVMSAGNNNSLIPGEVRRLGYYTGAGATLNWDFPGASDSNNDIGPGTAGSFPPSWSRIVLNLETDGYTVSHARATSWTSAVLPYNEAAGDLVAIQFEFQGAPGSLDDRSGFFIDNLYAGAKSVPEPSTATLLLLGVVGVRYGRKFLKHHS